MYLAEDGNGAVNHSRMRMGLSALNAHRKRYNFIDSSRCDFCGHRCENPVHFFLSCPTFAAQRQVMMDGMGVRVPAVVQPYHNNQIGSLQFSKVLLYGTREHETDVKLFKIVQTYITSTNRCR